MAGAGSAASDVWHRSLEDLLQAIETAEAATAGSFVINLQSGAAPIGLPAKDFPQFEQLRVYQLARGDGHSARFQLRLGIIQSDLEADAILATVRKHYPSATKQKVEEADRSAVAAATNPERAAEPGRAAGAAPAISGGPAPEARRAPGSASSAPSSASTATLKPVASLTAQRPAAVAAAAAQPLLGDAQWNIDDLLPGLARSPVAKAEAAPRAASPARTPPAPRAVGAHISPRPPAPQLPTRPPIRPPLPPPPLRALTTAPANARAATVRAASTSAADTNAAQSNADMDSADGSGADSASLQSVVARIGTLIDAVEAHEERAAPAPRQPHSAPRPRIASQSVGPRQPDDRPQPTRAPEPDGGPRLDAVPSAPSAQPGTPNIDSTQTVRALTAAELADTEASSWFAIQLTCSDTLIDADQVPNLDIFTEYRLYSAIQPGEGSTLHALRVGFFSSAVAAEAVAGYLSAYFPSPTIARVSIAERERFADKLVVARKDVGATGCHAVIEFVAAPAVPEVRAETVAPDSAKRTKQDGANASLWSRLRGLRAQG